jgi:transposase-like protein
MSTKNQSTLPKGRRYSAEEKAQAVRLARTLRDELGTSHGTVQRVANQLGFDVESVRGWVRQAVRSFKTFKAANLWLAKLLAGSQFQHHQSLGIMAC